MKFDLGETEKETIARMTKWHWWFAWHPVQITEHDWRWLEHVQRCASFSFSGYITWNYREKEPTE
jgi:hypothetical protein